MNNQQAIAQTPTPVYGIYDEPMWASIRKHAMVLQQCKNCEAFQYPPAAVCSHCMSSVLSWRPISGQATIISWVVFHKTYLDAYPAPYNVIATRLDEGPVFISNLEGAEPIGSWIGAPVRMVYRSMADAVVLPKFILAY